MRNRPFDLIRVLATIGVVAIHTDVITSSPTNYLGGMSWWFTNTIHSLASVSVPLFAMLTGALLSDKETLSWVYVRSKVIMKFLIPLLFWWIFATATTSRFSLFDFFFSKVGHLYYLQIVMGLYLLAPVILKKWQHVPVRYQSPLLWFVTLIAVVNNYSSFLWFKTYGQTNILVISLPFVCYFLWGAVLKNSKLTLFQQFFASVAALLLTLITSQLTYLNVLWFNAGMKLFWTPSSGNLFFEPFTLTVLPLSLLVFVILNSVQIKHSPLLIYLSGLTYGIYLIHPYVLNQLDSFFHLSVHFISYPLWIYYLFKIFLVAGISGFMVAVIRRIPIIRTFIGG